MSARPMIVMRRIGPAAPGLRDMASAAEDVARPWAIAPAAAAIPSRNAAERAPHRTPLETPPVVVGSWASAGSARQASATIPITNAFLSIPNSPSSSRTISVFFVGRGQVDVDRRERNENERLEQGREEAQNHQGPWHED